MSPVASDYNLRLIKAMNCEMMSSLSLTFYGNAAFAATILEGKGVPDVFGVTWAWGVGVILGITASGGISGHINPGVTVAFAAVGKFPWKKVPVYLLAQHLGGFFASAVLFFTYYDAFNNYDPERTVVGETRSAWVFATYPRDDIAIWNCFFGEIVAEVFSCSLSSVLPELHGSDQPSSRFPYQSVHCNCWLGKLKHLECAIMATELHWPEKKDELEDGDIPLSIEDRKK
ncbi:hypothetical protein CEXT_736012 [Caerostris extrusa]|uniref:Aquaporin n=1 Tax=Caerostris extrusa TaxID=172846 RepID=A0AAV4URI9_CAEEX|nr:hypothetical protein CEXT_736012 [Caerostris extrusa]